MPGKRLVLCIYKNPPASRILFLEDKDVNGQIMPLFTEPAFVFQYIHAHELQNNLGMSFFWQSYIHVVDGKQYQFRRIIAVDRNTATDINVLYAFAEIGAVTEFFCLELGMQGLSIGLDCPTRLKLRTKPYYNSELTKDQDPMRALISAASLYCSNVYNQERMARTRMQSSMLQPTHNTQQAVPVQLRSQMPAIAQDAIVNMRPAAHQSPRTVPVEHSAEMPAIAQDAIINMRTAAQQAPKHSAEMPAIAQNIRSEAKKAPNKALVKQSDSKLAVGDGFVLPSRRKTAKPQASSLVGSIAGAHNAPMPVAEMPEEETHPQGAEDTETRAPLIVRRLKLKASQNAAKRVANTTAIEDEFLAQCIAANAAFSARNSEDDANYSIDQIMAQQLLFEQRAAMEENDRNYALSLSERNTLVRNKAITLSFFIFMFYMTAQILNSVDNLEQDKKANRISDVEYSDKIANLNVQIMISCCAVAFAISKLIGRIANKCMDSKFAFALHRQLQAEAYTNNGSKIVMSEDGVLKTTRPHITR